MRTVVHRGLSGARIAVVLPDEIVPNRVGTNVAYYSVDGVEQEFTAGPLDLGAAVANEFGIRLDEHYRMQQGAFYVGSKVESWTVPEDGYQFSNKHMLAVWEGAARSVHTHLYDASSADALALFGRFGIVETSDGIQMTPRAANVRTGSRPETLMINLPVLGLFIVRKKAGAAELPRWRGSTVAGGEAYCDKKDPSRPTFLLASDSALATVVPDHPGQVDRGRADSNGLRHQRSIDLLQAIEVDWVDTR